MTYEEYKKVREYSDPVIDELLELKKRIEVVEDKLKEMT